MQEANDKFSEFETLDGIKLPYFIEGSGTPCIVTCDPLYEKRVLSNALRTHFKFVFFEKNFLFILRIYYN